jgi:hypothetical protein
MIAAKFGQINGLANRIAQVEQIGPRAFDDAGLNLAELVFVYTQYLHANRHRFRFNRKSALANTLWSGQSCREPTSSQRVHQMCRDRPSIENALLARVLIAAGAARNQRPALEEAIFSSRSVTSD